MRFSRRAILICILAGLVLSFCAVGIVSASRKISVKQVGFAVKPGTATLVDQVLVKFKAGVPRTVRNRIMKDAGIDETIKIIGPRNHKKTYVFALKPGGKAGQAVRKLKLNPNIAVVEENNVRKSYYVPNDAFLGSQWGLEDPGFAGQGINVEGAWDFEQGYSSTVTVAVIDSGIDLNHPDLVNKIWRNLDEVPKNGIDDDHNGYVDDIQGYNFAGISFRDYNWVQPLGNLNYQWAQSIKGTGGILDWVGMVLLKVGEPNFGAVVSIKDSLTGLSLATGTILPVDVPAAPADLRSNSPAYAPGGELSMIETTLSSPVNLSDGQTYYITLETTSTDARNYYLVADLASPLGEDKYADGMEHWKVGNTWMNMPNHDMTFRTGPNAIPRDDSGHGTHVSGIVGAQTDNVIGVAGVAPGAVIMPIKASGSEGMFYKSDVIDAINYAADNGANVINMSLGGPGYSDLEQSAIYDALAKGATLVASAGDDHSPGINYPAGYDGVIGVGALKNWWDSTTDTVSGLVPMGYWYDVSNFNQKVDFSAPGEDILSTMPTYPVALGGPDYGYLSGTSMAAPFVSGLAALIVARQPDANSVQVEKVLERGADDMSSPGPQKLGYFGYNPWFGHGEINAYQSLMRLMLSTRALFAPTQPDGDNGWYTTTPTIFLQIDTSGAISHYAWGADPDTTYTGSFSPPAEGVNELSYFSTLNAATEDIRYQLVLVDTGIPSDPTTVTSPSHTTGTVSANPIVNISVSGADDPVSEVEGYSLSWSENNTATPSQVLTHAAAQTDFSSPTLADGTWWFNLRTKDYAGNWTSTVHMGPFVIDGPPVTGRAIVPAAPDGDSNWYKTPPLVTLTPNQIAHVHYQIDSGGWNGDLLPDLLTNVLMPEGQHSLSYFSVDLGGNTETTNNVPLIQVDTANPAGGAITINGGAAKTNTTTVNLALSATDSGSGLSKMRFKNETGGWSAWEAYATAKFWNLTAGVGDKTVYAEFRDIAGNVSASVSDSIIFRTDQLSPLATVRSPRLSTNVSSKKSFTVSWSATDPVPTSGLADYDVQVKNGPGGTWTNWKTDVTATSGVFVGGAGRNYYFRARATDNSDNVGVWSKAVMTITPYDQDGLVIKRVGFDSVFSNASAKFYLGSIRYSTKAGDSVTYKVTGKSFILIGSKGPNRSRATVKVDGAAPRTIDAHADALSVRQKVFSVGWATSGTHIIKITNLATPGRPLFDLDGTAVRK